MSVLASTFYAVLTPAPPQHSVSRRDYVRVLDDILVSPLHYYARAIRSNEDPRHGGDKGWIRKKCKKRSPSITRRLQTKELVSFIPRRATWLSLVQPKKSQGVGDKQSHMKKTALFMQVRSDPPCMHSRRAAQTPDYIAPPDLSRTNTSSDIDQPRRITRSGMSVVLLDGITATPVPPFPQHSFPSSCDSSPH